MFDIDRTVSPLEIKLFGRQPKPFLGKVDKPVILSTEKSVGHLVSDHLKTSFEPVSDTATTILILGTMPGDQSLKLGEYYGHPRNRFWKIISTITGNQLPLTYADKKKLLLDSTIAVWDVALKADRKGSFDSAIEGEEPNDIDSFISKHKNLKVIGFNGAKSAQLFSRYFTEKVDIKYFLLPSTSPANTGINMQNSCKAWQVILDN